MELDLKLDRKDIARFRTLAKANRLMAAKSLTQVAYKARDEWKVYYKLFHMRRAWLTTGGRVHMATPSKLQSAVYHLDKYFGRHVKGIDTPKRSAGQSLFVPAQPVQEQGTHTQIRNMLRRADKTKTRKTFRVRDMVFRRMRKDRDSIKLLGVLRREVDIAPRFDALRYTSTAVRREFPTIYERLLLQWARSGKA